MVEDQRFAARRPDVLVYQTDAAGRRPHPRRADPGLAPGEHHRDRRRLGGQADRRLPQRLRRPRTEPRRRPDGRLSATRPRRRDAWEVPPEFRDARTVRAGRRRPRSRSPSRTSPTPSAPGTGSWCRSRAPGSPWSTATRKPSSRSTRPRPATSSRPPTGSTTRPTGPSQLERPGPALIGNLPLLPAQPFVVSPLPDDAQASVVRHLVAVGLGLHHLAAGRVDLHRRSPVARSETAPDDRQGLDQGPPQAPRRKPRRAKRRQW